LLIWHGSAELAECIVEPWTNRRIKQATHSGYIGATGRGLLDDQAIDQKKDNGRRRGADRPDDDYSDTVDDVGD
jgi:hypothetical protein